MSQNDPREFDDVTLEIARLNDELRTTFNPAAGQIVLTRNFSALPLEEKNVLIGLVQTFNDFSEDDDPYGQHDFGAVTHKELNVFGRSTSTMRQCNLPPLIQLIHRPPNVS